MHESIVNRLFGNDISRLQRWAHLSIRITGMLARLNPVVRHPPWLPVSIMGLTLPNPVGLAAGFDRQGDLLDALADAGFGFIEVGTLNPAPGGMADPAIDRAAFNLRRFRDRHPPHDANTQPLVGVSVGSLHPVLDGRCAEDYLSVMRRLGGCADYLVLNLSRPCGPGRTAPIDAAALRAVLTQARRGGDFLPHRIPMTVKVAFEEGPDQDTPPAVSLAMDLGYDGILAAFEHWSTPARVAERIARLRDESPSLPIIAVGGVHSAATAEQYLTAGASAVQVYTALLRQGPSIARRIASHLLQSGHGIRTVREGSVKFRPDHANFPV